MTRDQLLTAAAVIAVTFLALGAGVAAYEIITQYNYERVNG